MKTLKKGIALLLVLAMSLSMMSLSVFAEDVVDTPSDDVETVEVVTEPETPAVEEQAEPTEETTEATEAVEPAAEVEEETDEAEPAAEVEEETDEVEPAAEAEEETDEVEPAAEVEEETEAVESEEDAEEVEEEAEEEKVEEKKEEAKPAQPELYPEINSIFSAAAGGYKVTVMVPAGSFAEDFTFRVFDPQLTAEEKAALGFAADDAVLDIGFVNADGVEIEPVEGAQINVAINIAEVEAEAVEVYHVEDDEAVLVAESDGDVAKFDVGSFSLFVVKSVTTQSGNELRIVEEADGYTLKPEEKQVYLVSDGFYQDGTTYSDSNNFYITSKAGLYFFRYFINYEIVNGVDIASQALGGGNQALVNYNQNNPFSGKTVHLLTDVDLDNDPWVPIGYQVNPRQGTILTSGGLKVENKPFYGNFDGHSHTISNLNVSYTGNVWKTCPIGLFGNTPGTQSFSNLTINNVSANGVDYVGALIGNAGSNLITLTNCSVTGDISIISREGQAGGLIGLGNVEMERCSVTGTSESSISAPLSFSGGLAGNAARSKQTTIKDSSVSGPTVSGWSAGGIVGTDGNGTTLTNTTVTGTTVNGKANLPHNGSSVAKIGSTEYLTLKAAIDNAQDGDTVTLLKDVDITDTFDSQRTKNNINIQKSLTIDGSGYTVKVSKLGIALGYGLNDAESSDDITVTFQNITVLNENSGDVRCLDTRGNVKKLVLDNAKLKSTSTGQYAQPLTLSYTTQTTDVMDVVIKNGSLIQTDDDGAVYYAVIVWTPVNMTITDSTLKGWACLYFKPGSSGSTVSVDKSNLISKNVHNGTSNAFSAIKIEVGSVEVGVTNSHINVTAASDQKQGVVAYAAKTASSLVTLGTGNQITLTSTSTGAPVVAYNVGNYVVYHEAFAPYGKVALTGGTYSPDHTDDNLVAAGYTAIPSDADGNYKTDGAYYTVVPEYTVTWRVDGQNDTTTKVAQGMTPVYTGIPTKATVDGTTYTFTGWSPALKAATADVTYTAQFTENAAPSEDGKVEIKGEFASTGVEGEQQKVDTTVTTVTDESGAKTETFEQTTTTKKVEAAKFTVTVETTKVETETVAGAAPSTQTTAETKTQTVELKSEAQNADTKVSETVSSSTESAAKTNVTTAASQADNSITADKVNVAKIAEAELAKVENAQEKNVEIDISLTLQTTLDSYETVTNAETHAVTVSSMTYDVTPYMTTTVTVNGEAGTESAPVKVSNEVLAETVKTATEDAAKITFRLPVPDSFVEGKSVGDTLDVKHIHEDEDGNVTSVEAITGKIGGGPGNFYVEIAVTEFSKFEVLPAGSAFHTVSFNSAGGSSVADQVIVSGSTAEQPSNPTRSGYSFNGWTLDGSAYDFSTPVTEDLTLTAQWTQNVIVTPVSDEGGIFVPTGGNNSGEVEITDEETPLSDLPIFYVDVATGDWFRDAVAYVTNLGLMNGVGDQHFDPNASTTRGMVATILMRMAKGEAVDLESFDDVANDAYYAEAAAWAVENDVFNGYEDSTFRGETVITREQLATVLYRYALSKGFKADGSVSLDAYADGGKVSSYATEAMKWALANGILKGVSETEIDPTGAATRAQLATIMMRFNELTSDTL